MAAAWALAAVGLAVALALAVAGRGRGIWGDEDTYMAMTASLARDGDLAFDERDRQWAVSRPGRAPATLILQRVGTGVSYSKPVVYPLLALPAYLLLGPGGLVATNLLLAAAALLTAWFFLRRLGPPSRAALTLLTFAACGVLPFYLGWRMSDVAQVACGLAGLALVAGALRAASERREQAGGAGASHDGRWAGLRPLAAGGVLLGILAAMRLPGLALAVAAVTGAVWLGRRRAAAGVALGALLGFGLASGAGLALAGSANPYKEVRASFNGTTGYPVGDSDAWRRFTSNPATQSAGWLPRLQWTRSLYSGLYFLVGRHTGLAAYFPAALVLLLTAWSGRQRLSLALLAGVAAIVGFHLLWLPENYFGGSTFFGNRYFLTAYPALLAALPRLPSARALALCWLVGLAVGISALVSQLAVAERPAPSQSHAAAGVFRLLPSETTVLKVDGFRDRYWGLDFVRFVDRFAEDGEDSFRLASGAPSAELQLAFRIPRDTLRLEVDPGASGGELVWRDWSGGGALTLEPGPQEVELRLGPAWRWHTSWWQAPDIYQVRTLRLGFRGAAGGEAVLRYPARRRPRQTASPAAARLSARPANAASAG